MDRKAAKELVHIRGWLERVDEITERGKETYLADALQQEPGDPLMMKLGRPPTAYPGLAWRRCSWKPRPRFKTTPTDDAFHVARTARHTADRRNSLPSLTPAFAGIHRRTEGAIDHSGRPPVPARIPGRSVPDR